MTGDQYQKAIDHLGMTQVGSARFLGVDESTPRRWISGKRRPIPRPVAMLLRVMIHHKLDPLHVLELEDNVAL